MTSVEIAKKAAKILDDKLAKDVKILKLEGLTAIADYFVIASGSSISQVKSLTEYLDEGLARENIFARKVEGENNADWTLSDYRDVIVHIFTEESRQFYSLERLWADAPEIEF